MDKRMISNIVLSMREFQKTHCIKEQCVTNAQYLYDCIKVNSLYNVKVKPVIVVSFDNVTKSVVCVGGHLIVVLDDETIFEPSYDVFALKNKSYFDNIKMLMDSYDNELKTILKKSICYFIPFVKLAERINNGELVICDKDFYNNQADYIDKTSI
jgi:hypothetical protein